jgi:hypothetical protein
VGSFANRKAAALGLKLSYDSGHYVRDTTSWAVGESAGFGGVAAIQEHGYSTYLTAPEVAWIVGEMDKRNLTQQLAQIFFHDDTADVTQGDAECVCCALSG